jgi:ABC-type multidrug transport system fused ATPase/permease subunit
VTSGSAAARGWENERFAFLCDPTSSAVAELPEIVSRAESTWAHAGEWFGPGTPPKMTIHLCGWLELAPAPGVGLVPGGLVALDRPVAWLLVGPEHPALGLEPALLEILAREVPGRKCGGFRGLLPGLAGLVAAEKGLGPEPAASDAAAFESYRRDRRLPQLFGPDDPGVPREPDAAELSFLRHLRSTRGAPAFARFVREALAAGPGPAAAAAYGRSLDQLEAEWLQAIETRARQAGSGLLRRAGGILRPYWLRVAELMGYMGIDLAVALALPLGSRYLFDQVLPQRDFTRLAVWAAAMLALFTGGVLVGYRRLAVGGLIGERVLYDLRRAAFDHLQRLSMRFYARKRTGDLVSRITNDLEDVRQTVADTLPDLVFQVASLVVCGAVLLALSWKLGLLILVLAGSLLAALYVPASLRLREASRELQDRIGGLGAFVQENLSAQIVVKCFTLEARAAAAFERILKGLFDGSMRLIRTDARLTSSTELVFLSLRVAVLGAGALLVMRDELTIGDLVAFVALTSQVLTPMMSISGRFRQLQTSVGAFERVEELFAETPEVADAPGATGLADLRREIRLEAVTVRYSDGRAALREVTLRIPAGTRVGVVGPSGAGKSTLVGLLLRLHDPDEGRVLFDDQDLRMVTLASLRRQLAVVPQEAMLFDASIAENIQMGRPDADRADVERAAKAAALDEVVRATEGGYGTMVGERGVRLSGGQRQRLAIARALVRRPRLLLLDEATSALDSETEAAVLGALEDAGDRTVVMITHRLAAVARCDRIFVLDQGRLAEEGSHAELCEQGGLYWRLLNEQRELGTAGPLPIQPRRLARIPLFAELGSADLEALARRLSVERYRTETNIVRQGEPADRLFFVAEGEVEVLVADQQGRERFVTKLAEGTYFGEIALLGDASARRTATVRSLTPVTLLSLHKEDFQSLLKTQPRIAETVARAVQQRVERTREISALAGPA